MNLEMKYIFIIFASVLVGKSSPVEENRRLRVFGQLMNCLMNNLEDDPYSGTEFVTLLFYQIEL